MLAPNKTLSLGIGDSRPLLLKKEETSNSTKGPGPSSKPILISSIAIHSPSSPADSSSLDQHLLVVDKIVDVLAGSSHSDHSMDDSASEDLDTVQEVEDDMTLGRYQKEAKSEAIARRAPSKKGKKPKKGRSSPLI